jgi:hypothetical protein
MWSSSAKAKCGPGAMRKIVLLSAVALFSGPIVRASVAGEMPKSTRASHGCGVMRPLEEFYKTAKMSNFDFLEGGTEAVPYAPCFCRWPTLMLRSQTERGQVRGPCSLTPVEVETLYRSACVSRPDRNFDVVGTTIPPFSGTATNGVINSDP